MKTNYIESAKRVLSCQNVLNTLTGEYEKARRDTSSSMHRVNVTDFNFPFEGKVYNCSLSRPPIRKVNVRKLYALAVSGDIALDSFLDSIDSSVERVSEVFGESLVNLVTDKDLGPLDLVITEL